MYFLPALIILFFPADRWINPFWKNEKTMFFFVSAERTKTFPDITVHDFWKTDFYNHPLSIQHYFWNSILQPWKYNSRRDVFAHRIAPCWKLCPISPSYRKLICNPPPWNPKFHRPISEIFHHSELSYLLHAPFAPLWKLTNIITIIIIISEDYPRAIQI